MLYGDKIIKLYNDIVQSKYKSTISDFVPFHKGSLQNEYKQYEINLYLEKTKTEFWTSRVIEVVNNCDVISPIIYYKEYFLQADFKKCKRRNGKNKILVDCHINYQKYAMCSKPGDYHLHYFVNGQKRPTARIIFRPDYNNACDFLELLKRLHATKGSPFD